MNLLSETNAYIDSQAPWNLKKTNIERMNTVLFLSLNIIVKASIMLLPIIPNSANKVLDILNISLKNRNFHNIEQLIDANLNINNPVPIFPRIEK